MQSTTDQVRQILMNELGLTRESIRKLAEEIVTKTVDAHMATMEKDGTLLRITESAFSRRYSDGGYRQFKDLIVDSTSSVVRRFMADRMVIEFKNTDGHAK